VSRWTPILVTRPSSPTSSHAIATSVWLVWLALASQHGTQLEPSVPHLDHALTVAGRQGRQLPAILEAAGAIHLWAMTLFLGILGFLVFIVRTVFLHGEDPRAPHLRDWDRRLTWLAGWSLLAALLSSAGSFVAHVAIAGWHAPTHARIANVVDGIVVGARSGYAEQLNAALALIMAGHCSSARWSLPTMTTLSGYTGSDAAQPDGLGQTVASAG
jgi:hypothetical protein